MASWENDTSVIIVDATRQKRGSCSVLAYTAFSDFLHPGGALLTGACLEGKSQRPQTKARVQVPK